MANSKIPNVDVTDTFNTQRVRFNKLLDSVGDVSTLTTTSTDITSALNEHDSELGTITAVAMGTTANTVSTAINELDGRLDSINDTQIQSPKLYMNDSSAVNFIKGGLMAHSSVYVGNDLKVADSTYIVGNLTVGGNTQLSGTLTVDGVVNFKAGADGSVTLGDANTDNVVFNADVNSSIVPNTDNTFDIGSASQEWRHGYFDGTLNADNVLADSSTIGTLKVSDLTDNRVVISGASGEIEDDANLTFDGSRLVVGAAGADVTGMDADSATMGTAKVTDLTDNRVVIAGTGGELEDDANLTYDGTDLSANSLIVTDLTDNRVVIAGTGGSVEDDANLTFDASRLTVGAAGIDTTGLDADSAVLGTVKVSDLTDNRVVIAGTSGELEDDGNFTYDGDKLTIASSGGIDTTNLLADSATVTGDLDVQGYTTLDSATVDGELVVERALTVRDSAYITGDLDVGANLTVATQATLASAAVSDLTSGRVVIAGTSGELQDDAKLTWNTTTGLKSTEALTIEDSAYITGNLTVGGNTTMSGTLTVDGQVTFKAGADNNIALGDASTDTITITGEVNSSVVPDADNTYDLGSSLKEWRHGYFDGTVNADNVSADSATVGTMKVSDLTDNRVVIAGTSGELEDNANLTFDGTNFEVGTALDISVSEGNITTTGAISSGDITATSAKVSDLTNNRVVIVGADGELEDDNSFTFDGIKLTVGSTTIDFATAGVNTTGLDADSATLGTVKVSDLTSGRVLVAGTSGEVQDDAKLTWNTTTGLKTTEALTVEDSAYITGNLDVNGATTLAIATIDSNLTVNGYTYLDSATIDGDANVTGDLSVTGGFTVGGTFTVAGEQRTTSQYIFLLDETTASPTLDAGITVDRGTQDSAMLQWNETNDYWEAGLKNAKYQLVTVNSVDSSTITSVGGTISVKADGVTLGTHTTGNYMDDISATAGTGISVTHTAAEGSSATIAGIDATTSVKGVASFSSDNFSVSSGAVSIKDNGITLGTETTGNYVDSIGVTSGTGLSISFTPSEGAGALISGVDATTSVKGVASFDSNNFSVTSGAVSIKDNGITLGTETTGNYVDSVGVTPGTGLSISFSAGEGAGALISGVNATNTVKGVASFSSNDFSVSSGAVTIKNDGVTLGTQTSGNYVATIVGTSNEIEVSGSGSETAAVTIGLPNDVTVSNNLTVSGDLVVEGTQTITGASTTASAYFTALSGVGTGAANAGFAVFRSNTGNDSAYVQWNETSDYWEVGVTGDLQQIARHTDDVTFGVVTGDSAQFNHMYIDSARIGTVRFFNDDSDEMSIYSSGRQLNIRNLTEEGAIDIRSFGTDNLGGNITLYAGDDITLQPLYGNVHLGNGSSIGLTVDPTLRKIENIQGTASMQFLDNQIKMYADSAVDVRVVGSLDVDGGGVPSTFGGDVVVSGNLTVSGTTTTVNTETINLADNIILINSNATGTPSAVTDGGIEVERGSSTNVQLLWDESAKYWVAANDSSNDLSRIATANFISATAPISWSENDGIISHDLSGATAGQYGSGTAVPQITVDSTGHVTSVSSVSITSDNYGSWTLAADGGSSQTISSGNTATISGGTYLSSTASATDTVTINHDNTTRTNSSTDSSPDHGATFPVISSITSNATGHITAVTTTNITLPEVGASNAVSASAGTDITLTLAENGDVIEFRTTDKNSAFGTQGAYGPRLQFATNDLTAGWGIRTYGSDATMQTRMFFDSAGIQIGGDIVLEDGASPIVLTAEEVNLTLRGSLILDGTAPLVTSTSDVTIDVTGDITLDADGNNIYFKNGAGNDTWTWTLNDSATGQFSAPNDFVLTTTSGDITLRPTGDDVYMQGITSGEQLRFNLGTGLQTITSSDQFWLQSSSDIYMVAPNQNIYMRGVTTSAQLSFNVDSSSQTITSSDTLEIKSPSGYNFNLNSGSGRFYYEDVDTRRFILDADTAETLELFVYNTAGSSANKVVTFGYDQNATFEGDVTSLSDARTKENVETVENGLELVDQLRGVWYNKLGSEERKVGVIAQEVEEVLPEVVRTDPAGMKSVDYGKMVGVLIEAIKDLKAEVEELKANKCNCGE